MMLNTNQLVLDLNFHLFLASHQLASQPTSQQLYSQLPKLAIQLPNKLHQLASYKHYGIFSITWYLLDCWIFDFYSDCCLGSFMLPTSFHFNRNQHHLQLRSTSITINIKFPLKKKICNHDQNRIQGAWPLENWDQLEFWDRLFSDIGGRLDLWGTEIVESGSCSLTTSYFWN